MEAIREINPYAQLIQTDDLAKVHSSLLLTYQAEFENNRRWLSFDLLCGRVDTNHVMWDYLVDNGISAEELTYFQDFPCPPAILGFNYYLTSERYLDEDLANYPLHTHGGNGRHIYADVEAVRVAKASPAGLQNLLKAAWERYRIPIALTEVHLHCTREEQMRWLNESWLTANQLCREGIPILAITPWALLGSYGWDHLLTNSKGTYEPGVFDVSNGQIRPTILAEMIKAFSQNKQFDHPVLGDLGWWNRAYRITYGNKCLDIKPSSMSFLAVKGIHAKALADICYYRGLCVEFTEYFEIKYPAVWATIMVAEHMEIKCEGKPDLVVPLYGDLYRNLNAGLDLLLDGESGHWEIDQYGICSKLSTDATPLIQYLVS